MGLIINPYMFGSPAAIAFVANAADGTDLTTYSFAGQNLGTASADRYIVAAFAHRAGAGTPTGSSVTIGGVSATFLAGVSNGTGRCELWIAAVPTGTTGTIAITWSAGVARCVMGAWALTNLQSSTPTATYSSTASPMSASANISAGGVALALGFANVAATATWAGLTEDFDNTTADSCIGSGASLAFATAQTGLTISMTGSVALSPDPVFMAAAFR